jgi:hypothetical protein
MNRKTVLLFGALSAAVGAAGSASARVGVEFFVPPVVVGPVMAPPPPVVAPEPLPPPPGPVEAMVWVPGHYEWSGRAYYWVHGHYIQRPEPGLIWEPGVWVNVHGHYEWHGGHWRR